MAFDIKRLKKHGYPTIGISSADYKSLSKKNKIIFNAHNSCFVNAALNGMVLTR